MATITNRMGLPAPILRAALNDSYTRGGAKISVTELIGSPRIRMLRQRHRDKIVEDVGDRFWAIIGSALHHVLQVNAEEHHTSEERLYATVEGWVISGGIDLQIPTQVDGQNALSLADYKMTSAWAVMNAKPDWERQLNLYAYLVRQSKGIAVSDLNIIAIIRDWSRHQSKLRNDYPNSPMMVIPQRLWSEAETEEYVKQRVLVHQQAERSEDWGEDLVECSEEERWTRPTTYAAMKPGNKRATKVFSEDEKALAEKFVIDNKLVLDVRVGENIRCADFCSVADFCEQYQAIKALKRESSNE